LQHYYTCTGSSAFTARTHTHTTYTHRHTLTSGSRFAVGLPHRVVRLFTYCAAVHHFPAATTTPADYYALVTTTYRTTLLPTYYPSCARTCRSRHATRSHYLYRVLPYRCVYARYHLCVRAPFFSGRRFAQLVTAHYFASSPSCLLLYGLPAYRHLRARCRLHAALRTLRFHRAVPNLYLPAYYTAGFAHTLPQLPPFIFAHCWFGYAAVPGFATTFTYLPHYTCGGLVYRALLRHYRTSLPRLPTTPTVLVLGSDYPARSAVGSVTVTPLLVTVRLGHSAFTCERTGHSYAYYLPVHATRGRRWIHVPRVSIHLLPSDVRLGHLLSHAVAVRYHIFPTPPTCYRFCRAALPARLVVTYHTRLPARTVWTLPYHLHYRFCRGHPARLFTPPFYLPRLPASGSGC